MSLNIVIDADVQTATAKIGKFVYTFKESFKEIEDTVKRTSSKVKQETDQIGNSVKSFGKSSQNALTALSLTIQDLPFGFIGIQNNLPGIVQGFTQMAAEAKAGTSVLSQLSSTLIGPTGLFLAFSAVTAAVTYAVQKYGSLSGAIDSIIGGSRQLTKEQKDIAANVAEESTKALTLYSLYKNLDGERTKQYEIIKKLNDISPEYFGNLDAEKTKIDDLKGSIDRYIDSFIGKIYIETQQKKITELATKYAEKISLVIDKEVELDNQREKAGNKIKNFIRDTELLAKTQQNASDIGIGLNQPYIKKTTQEVITQLKSDFQNALEQIFKSVGKFKNFIDIGEIFGDPKKSKALKEKVFPSIEDIFKELVYLRDKWTEDTSLFKYFEKASKGLEKFRKENVEVETKFKVPTTLALSPMMKQKMEELKKLAQEFTNVKEILTQTFFNPLENLFTNFFETGKFAFKSFADAVLKEIQRLVARIIATGIIKLLASILVPGGAAAVAATGLKSVSTGALADFLGGGVRNPSFGGVQGGGLGMSGQVALVLRGQDLVGAINRTNTTINRVG